MREAVHLAQKIHHPVRSRWAALLATDWAGQSVLDQFNQNVKEVGQRLEAAEQVCFAAASFREHGKHTELNAIDAALEKWRVLYK